MPDTIEFLLYQIVEAVNAQMEGRNSVEVLMKPLPRGTHRLPEWVEDRQAPPRCAATSPTLPHFPPVSLAWTRVVGVKRSRY
jgi:hypothetical protein